MSGGKATRIGSVLLIRHTAKNLSMFCVAPHRSEPIPFSPIRRAAKPCSAWTAQPLEVSTRAQEPLIFVVDKLRAARSPAPAGAPATAGDANGSSPLLYSCLAARTVRPFLQTHSRRSASFTPILTQNTQKGNPPSAG